MFYTVLKLIDWITWIMQFTISPTLYNQGFSRNTEREKKNPITIAENTLGQMWSAAFW